MTQAWPISIQPLWPLLFVQVEAHDAEQSSKTQPQDSCWNHQSRPSLFHGISGLGERKLEPRDATSRRGTAREQH